MTGPNRNSVHSICYLPGAIVIVLILAYLLSLIIGEGGMVGDGAGSPVMFSFLILSALSIIPITVWGSLLAVRGLRQGEAKWLATLGILINALPYVLVLVYFIVIVL